MSPESITSCELGPIRPPSEATSLLFRVTRNCPWNKCAFCAVYKRTRFSRREDAELHGEIELPAGAAARVRERAVQASDGAEVTPNAYLAVVNNPASTDEERRVALWLSRGGKHVFLQDADSLIMPPGKLAPILASLKEAFPSIDRVTTYARSRTLVARSPEQLATLKEAGLTRIHVGVESGSDAVLDLVKKGCRAEHHITGCRRAVKAGFEVCCYVMPGLGGKDLSQDHAVETARVLKEIDPAHVRLRTLWVDRGSPLHDMEEAGDFHMLEEDETVAEIRTMVAGLRGASGALISDHDRNLLMELKGHLTTDSDKLDAICAEFLDLDPQTRDAYVLARRSGHYIGVEAFLAHPEALESFKPAAVELRRAGDGSLVLGMKRGLRRRWI